MKRKKIEKDLLATLKAEKLVLDWRKKQQAMAAVEKEIEDELDRGLPDSYDADNQSVYEAVA